MQVKKHIAVKKKRRGLLFTLFLWIYLILAIVAILGALWLHMIANNGGHVGTTVYLYNSWRITGYICLRQTATFIFLLAIRKWKKWGVYAFGIAGCLYPLVDTYIGFSVPVNTRILGSIIFLIFMFLIYREWEQFE